MSRTPLAACPSCARHVRLSEVACPFCRADLPTAFREQRESAAPARRLHRAALYALRMGAVSMAAAACGGAVTVTSSDPGEGDAAAVDDAGGQGSSGGSSSGDSSSEGGTTSDSGGSPYDGPWGVAAYGGFIPFDSGIKGSEPDAGATDGEASDAKPDHVFIAPPYGIPPGG